MKKAQVINIIDSRNILINIGSDDGVEQRDEFNIYAQTGIEIHDPFTNEYLGKLEIKKEGVRAINVMPKMTVCGKKQNVRSQDDQERLNINFEDLTGEILLSDTRIAIGDYLRKLL